MKAYYIALIVLSFEVIASCSSVKKPGKMLKNVDSAIIPVSGCSGGFALRAKDAKYISNDTLALGLLADLTGAAKADAKTTDSLLTTGAKATIKGNLTTRFKKYFEIDQSIDENIWNQSNAFTQLYCMLDKISSDQNVSQSIRDDANTKKINLITSQTEYVRNTEKKKNQ